MAESVEYNGFKCAMLKLGGEIFGGDKVGVDPGAVRNVVQQIAEASRKGAEACIIIGGGNLFYGARLQQRSVNRTRSDHMGTLGTVINRSALQDFLEQEGADYRVQTVINMVQASEPYLSLRTKYRLERDRVVVFGAGIGMPYFSTDTTAAQRTLEIGCEVLLMTKTADGIYSTDPCKVSGAELLDDITHREVLERDLCVIDVTTSPSCVDNNMPILVSSPLIDGNIVHAIVGEQIGTLVHSR